MAIRTTHEFSGTSVELPSGTVFRFGSETKGEAKQFLPSPGRLRLERTPAEGELQPELQIALDEHEILDEEIDHFELELKRGEAPRKDTVDISIARPAPAGFERVVLYRDESGAVSWHFDQKASPLRARLTSVSRKNQRFVIPLRTAAARAAAEHNGRPRVRGVSHPGRKIFRVLLLPIASVLLDDPLNALVGVWEKRKRRDLLRTLTPRDYNAPNPQPFTDWEHLGSGRALLVIHGIFSDTQGMLRRLAPAQMEALHAQYAGRILAFDHFTLSRDPENNVRWFFEELRKRAGDRRFTFDVLCHSRGGIVARTLRERGTLIDPNATATVDKIFFAATPNRGSALADEKRLVELIDVFTNIATAATGGAVAVSLEVILSLLKLLAYTGVTKVPGIRAMGRDADDYVNATLNAREVLRPTSYAAVAAQYDPVPGDGALMTVANAVLDRVFGRSVHNDLVVPTGGVFEDIGAQHFSIKHRVYESGVWHTELFAEPDTVEDALAHFRGANEVAEAAISDSFESGDFQVSERIVRSEASDSSGGGVGDMDFSVSPGLERVTHGGGGVGFGMGGGVAAAAPRTDHVAVAAPSSTDGAATATAPSPEVTVQRDPRIDFHEQVQQGVPTALVVALDEVTAAAAADVIGIRMASGQDSVDITAQLFAPGFDITDGDTRKMTVRRTRVPADEQVTFTLVAKAVAKTTRREIVADFSIDGVSIGGVSHVTYVLADGPPGDRTPSFKPSFNVAAASRESAALKIIVSVGDKKSYAMKVTSNVPGFIVESSPMGEFSAPQDDITGHVNSTLQKIFAQRPSRRLAAEALPAAMKAWNEIMLGQLHNLGMELWERLPEKFQAFYFKLHDAKAAPRSIHIISDDMLFPWELAIPCHDGDRPRDPLAPLGMAHVVGRWKPGIFMKPDPQKVQVGKIAIVNPQYAPDKELPGAAKEAIDLAAFFGATCEVIRPCDTAALKGLTARTDVQLFHFTGHAQFDESNANESALLLEDGDLTASSFANSKFILSGPIVILNACSVGQAGMVASRAGGFAERCLQRGGAAVLAAYWEISDRSAATFSLAFYDKLKRGRSFGEALQELRVEKPDDPTYRAYTFFGDPLARIAF